jgi:putative tricarboxylic transport membrane protein
MNNNHIVDQIFNGFWILFGIGICVQSIRHQLWTPGGPGSGFIPFLTGMIIAGVGIMLFVMEGARSSKEAGRFWENSVAPKKVFYLVGSLCLMALLMLKLGFLLTSIVITGLMIQVIEPRRWIVVILTSTLSCLVIYCLFQFIMQIRLPKGLLGF